MLNRVRTFQICVKYSLNPVNFVSILGSDPIRSLARAREWLGRDAGAICQTTKGFVAVRVSLAKSERGQSLRIDRTGHLDPGIALIPGKCFLCQRAKDTIRFVGKVAESLQLALHVGHDLIRQKAITSINRSVVFVIGTVWIISPGGIPPAVVPTPIAQVDEDDRVAAVMPPITTMMIAMVIVMAMARLGPTRFATLPVS